MLIYWTLGAYSDNILTIFSNEIQDTVNQIVASFDPTKIGGVPLNDRSGLSSHQYFGVERPLPSITIGIASLGFSTCWGFADGMGMGGAVDTETSTPDLEFQTTKFPTDFTQYLNC
jgi:hypothetical protein